MQWAAVAVADCQQGASPSSPLHQINLHTNGEANRHSEGRWGSGGGMAGIGNKGKVKKVVIVRVGKAQMFIR